MITFKEWFYNSQVQTRSIYVGDCVNFTIMNQNVTIHYSWSTVYLLFKVDLLHFYTPVAYF